MYIAKKNGKEVARFGGLAANIAAGVALSNKDSIAEIISSYDTYGGNIMTPANAPRQDPEPLVENAIDRLVESGVFYKKDGRLVAREGFELTEKPGGVNGTDDLFQLHLDLGMTAHEAFYWDPRDYE